MTFNHTVKCTPPGGLCRNVTHILHKANEGHGGYGTHTVTIPAAAMGEGTEMVFTLYVSNFLGQKSQQAVTVRKVGVVRQRCHPRSPPVPTPPPLSKTTLLYTSQPPPSARLRLRRASGNFLLLKWSFCRRIVFFGLQMLSGSSEMISGTSRQNYKFLPAPP